MSQDSITIDQLTVLAADRPVIRKFSCVMKTGILTWITGENGAGKSSLLKALTHSDPSPAIRFSTTPSRQAITYYAPTMQVPAYCTVSAWLRFNARLFETSYDADRLLPDVRKSALLTQLSSGEAKRMLLWSLLRRPTLYTFLDEPYEHLSPNAKAVLTELLASRARDHVVVVATNQDVPSIADKQVVVLT